MTLPDGIINLIGVTETLSYSGDENFGFRLMPQYEILYKLETGHYTYKTTFEVKFGSSSSGYCSATFARYYNPVKVAGKLPPIHYTPPKPECRFIQKKEDTVIELVDEVGNVLLHLYVDPDEYYPRDSLTLNKEYFKRSNRVSDKHITYVLIGKSGIGKSYLGYFLSKNLEVYETDRFDYLPYDLITYDVIVLGNQTPGFTFERVVEALSEFPDNKIIKVLLQE